MSKLEIIYKKMSEIEFADSNPKDHDIGGLHQSFNRFQFLNALIENKTTGKLVAGHGRLETLRQKKQFGEAPPENIVVDEDGEWLVPITPVEFKSDEEAQAYLLADNRLLELGAWDTPKLLEELENLAKNSSLDGTGFDEGDIQAMYDEMEAGVSDGVDKGLPLGKPSYEVVFDDETQQAMFFEFVSWLKKTYDGETIGERLYQHIEICLGD